MNETTTKLGMKYISVTRALSPYADFSMINPEVLEAAAQRGTRVHTACSNYALGNYAYVPDMCKGFFESYKKWFDEYVEKVIAVEIALKCDTYGIVGHPDLIVLIKGDEHPTVIDLKTPITKNKLWEAQLAAYRYLAKKYNPKRVASLRLKRDGSMPLFDEYDNSEADFAAFLAALTATRYFGKEEKC